MHISIKRALVSSVFLKVISLIIGYMLWSIVAQSFLTSYWFKVPVCFYNSDATKQIQSPETIWIQLKGKRAALTHLDTSCLAVHVNMHDLKPGPNTIALSNEHLFIPPALALNDYIPHNIVVTVT